MYLYVYKMSNRGGCASPDICVSYVCDTPRIVHKTKSLDDPLSLCRPPSSEIHIFNCNIAHFADFKNLTLKFIAK